MATVAYGPDVPTLFNLVLRPERNFYWLILIYGTAVSALTLAVPLSVQVLISTVANTALLQPVVVLALVLFVLLLLSGLFVAVQIYLMELFERRFFSRIVSDVSLRLIYARHEFMERINRDELINRYFDIMTVQKSLPPLLTGALAIVLQGLVGVVLTSFYHPVFILFNLGVITLGYLVFRVFHSGAKRSANALSVGKYAAAEWLEVLTRTNSFFKSERTIDYAIERTQTVREDYLRAHRRHFHHTFAQVTGFLVLYATTSAALLGVGGWLVIHGQLSVGQLVAAELILSAVFASFSRLGYYLEIYYDLYAALSKLAQLFAIPLETPRIVATAFDWQPDIRFEHVHCALYGGDFHLHVELSSGSRTLVAARSSSQIKAFCELMSNYRRPDSGRVLLGGHDVDDFNVHQLRDAIHVIDDTTFPGRSIAEFLAMAAPQISRAAMRDMLDVVGLGGEIRTLVQGLDHVLTPYGHPLSLAGIIKLKIAHALLAQPRILVLTPLFDMVSPEARHSILRHLASCHELTVVCFSHSRDAPHFDRYMFWDFQQQQELDSVEALERLVRATGHTREQLNLRPSTAAEAGLAP